MFQGVKIYPEVGEHRHTESTDSDRRNPRTRQKYESKSYKECIESEKYPESIPSDSGFKLGSHLVEEKAIESNMKDTSVEELIEEYLKDKDDEVPSKESLTIHPKRSKYWKYL